MINSIRLWSEYYKEYVDWYDGIMFDYCPKCGRKLI